MTVYSVVGLCLCGAVAVFLMREMKREYVPAVTVGLGVTVIAACLPQLSESVGLLKGISGYIPENCAEAVIKGLGIACMTSVGAEISRSCGETSVGSYIEIAGKFGILALSLPLFRELIGLALLK